MEIEAIKWDKTLNELYKTFSKKVCAEIVVYNSDKEPYLEFADELIETSGKDIVKEYSIYRNHLVVTFH